MKHIRFAVTSLALAATALGVNAYDISVKNQDGQTFRATVDDLHNITFDTSGSPLTFTGTTGPALEAGNGAEDVTLRFNASMYWIVSDIDDSVTWLRFSKKYGAHGENQLTLSVDANDINAPRTANFTILCGFQKVEISLTQASKDVSNYVDIPDDNFRNYILTNFDADGDGRLSRQEAETITSIDCRNLSISSIAGVRQMTNLTDLNCAYNTITDALDLSGLTKLRTARTDHNLYESLSLAGCSALETLQANDNYSMVNYSPVYHLKSIDLSGCTSLKYVRLEDNALESIDLSDCSELTDIMLTINKLTQIDLTPCKKLVNAHMRTNRMTGTLDASECHELENLFVNDMQLTGINVTGCPKLRQLGATYNKIDAIDLTNCPELERLDIFSNNLSEIDLTNNTKLENLWIANNHLTTIDLSKNTLLKKLQAGNNEIGGTLDLSANSELTFLEVYGNKVEAVILAYSPNLDLINFNNNQLTSLDVTNAPNINSLVAYGNRLENVNLTAASNLSIINLDDNQLTQLDLSGCRSLAMVDINRNKLESLDVSNCSNLIELYATYNNMTSFIARDLWSLKTLELYNNQLAKLDLTGCIAIDALHFQNNNIEYFSPNTLEKLRYIDCRNNQLGSIDFSSNNYLQYAHGTGNPCKTVYLSEQAPNEQIVFDEDCNIFLGHPKDFDDVGGTTWGDGNINPWNRKPGQRK